jgi:hypothetical protein
MSVVSLRHQVRIILIACAALLVAVVIGGQASAQNQNTAISRGFKATGSDIVQGALVSTSDDDSTSVELATTRSASRLAGIVSKTTLVELSDNKKGEAQVILSGTATALVSDINGSIRAGDKITASPINGVGMLATEDSQIVGTAQSAFDAKNAESQTIADKNGKRHDVHIGSIAIQVGVSYYVAPTSQFLPPFLQNLANNIAGRPVSGARILLSGVLLLLAFTCIFALIYTSVRAGIISLGRNPLAANAIQRGLVGVAVTTLLVVTFTITAVYLILIY